MTIFIYRGGFQYEVTSNRCNRVIQCEISDLALPFTTSHKCESSALGQWLKCSVQAPWKSTLDRDWSCCDSAREKLKKKSSRTKWQWETKPQLLRWFCQSSCARFYPRWEMFCFLGGMSKTRWFQLYFENIAKCAFLWLHNLKEFAIRNVNWLRNSNLGISLRLRNSACSYSQLKLMHICFWWMSCFPKRRKKHLPRVAMTVVLVISDFIVFRW